MYLHKHHKITRSAIFGKPILAHSFTPIRNGIFTMVLFFIATTLTAQNVNLNNLGGGIKEGFKKNNILKLSGGLNINSVYSIGSDAAGRDPFNWVVGANINIQLFKQINLPFAFSFTNIGAGYNFPTPPNRLSLHPTYKWVTAHIGDVNISFSPYTLNGHLFRGLGLDLNPPGRVKLSVMYGRLQKAVEFDSTNPSFNTATYERWGYGAKLDYEREKYALGVTVFNAKDKLNSLQFSPDSLQIFPKQNLATSYTVVMRPARGLQFSGEMATSIFTTNTKAEAIEKSSFDNIRRLYFPVKSATSFNKALKMQFTYNIKKTVMGLSYERIDPGYQTLGTYFFANDLENATFNFSQILMNNKLTVSGNIGSQKDDINGTKSASNSRFIGSFNLNYMPSMKFVSSFSYSNFKTFMYVKPQFQSLTTIINTPNLDTLNFKQISESMNLNMNFGLKNNNSNNQNLNMNLSYQNANNIQGGVVQELAGAKIYNATAAYSLLLVPQKLNFNIIYSYNLNTIGGLNSTVSGPTLAVGTKLLNQKMSLNFSTSINKITSSAGGVGYNILNNRVNATYNFGKSSMQFNLMHQDRKGTDQSAVYNMVGSIGFNTSF